MTSLEARLGRVLVVGGAVSTGLLIAGLALQLAGSPWATPLLTAGLLVLMTTPVARVVISCAEYVREGDWFFAATTFAVLAVLAVSVIVALRGS